MTLSEKAALSLFVWTVLRGHVRDGGEIRLPSVLSVSPIYSLCGDERTCLALQEGQRNISSFGVTDGRTTVRREAASFSEEFSSAAATVTDR